MKICQPCQITTPDTETACPKCGQPLARLIVQPAAMPTAAAQDIGEIKAIVKEQHSGRKIGALIALPFFLFFFWSLFVSPALDQAHPHRVVYAVTGTSKKASLTYRNESGGTEQNTVQIPWTLVFTANGGSFLYISAQNQGDYGSVRTEISVDGVTIQSAESSERFGIASASGVAR